MSKKTVRLRFICGNSVHNAGKINIYLPSNKGENVKHSSRKRKKASLPFMFRLEMAGMLEDRGIMRADLYKGNREFEPISDNINPCGER